MSCPAKTFPAPWYDPGCQRCPRLSGFLTEVRRAYPAYACRPVPPFGDPGAALLVVGLAPGMHGANATGRPFTGDFAGQLLYAVLHQYRLASAPISSAGDALVLSDCRITNAVKCLPPKNKPVASEVRNCNSYLRAELHELNSGSVVVALGRIAFDATIRALGEPPSRFAFGHGACHHIAGLHVLASYHCSRYNTQTGRLTRAMFESIFERAMEYLNDGARHPR